MVLQLYFHYLINVTTCASKESLCLRLYLNNMSVLIPRLVCSIIYHNDYLAVVSSYTVEGLMYRGKKGVYLHFMILAAIILSSDRHFRFIDKQVKC